MDNKRFVNRDISWLYFNERVLQEAGNERVPLMDRFRFLSIFSSNLDEFYRVRMPAVLALGAIGEEKNTKKESRLEIAATIKAMISAQQQQFGVLFSGLRPLMDAQGITLNYATPIPAEVEAEAAHYFYTEILSFIQPVVLNDSKASFFPENNKLYLIVPATDASGKNITFLVNIPTGSLPRFFSVKKNEHTIILFIDDIINHHLPSVFRGYTVSGGYSFKITRDAELSLEDDYEGDLAGLIEEQISKRDFGLATRLLYDPAMPEACLQLLINTFGLTGANVVAGGAYHNLRDLSALPLRNPALQYEPWPAVNLLVGNEQKWLMDAINKEDILLHTPYHSYDTVLRFFNEASIDPEVEEIYVTLYRVADNSRIVNALISAAQNGKQVFVMVELKARFDEANNIKWARKLKTVGVKVIYSAPSLKVHAKIALVKKNGAAGPGYFGLLATGNLNETTARFYTDHILLTARKSILLEMEQLFHFLVKGEKPDHTNQIAFEQLLVAQFNLQDKFHALIDREIANAQQGLPAGIIIKMNNLEEKGMIRKLYEAAEAGVPIRLIIRGICCLNPDSYPSISVHRIVDRYLEHGRLFIFQNNGNEQVYLGSADWMNRNIFRRVEVCFPVYHPVLIEEIKKIVSLQLADNVQAVALNGAGQNVPLSSAGAALRSQEAIYKEVKAKKYEMA